jgi:hypothetical protein
MPQMSVGLTNELTGNARDRINLARDDMREDPVFTTPSFFRHAHAHTGYVMIARTRSPWRSVERSRERSPRRSSPLECSTLRLAGKRP